MPLWQICLIGLVVAWSVQALGTYVQMRHYSAVMGETAGAWPDGYLGAGNARAKLGAGVILLLVVDPDRIVRRLLIMRGRSVFARFRRVLEAEGRPVDRLSEDPIFGDKAHQGALAVALKQIDKAAATPNKAAA